MLFHDADFGAAILRPGCFVGGGIGRHFRAETDGLDVLRVGAHRDQGFADRLRAAFTEATIVFRRATFISKTGDDDLAVALLEETCDLLDLAVFGGADGLAVEVEIDRLKLVALRRCR